jgi:hypothetical protein
LFAQLVRFGDRVRFPAYDAGCPNVDALVASGDDGRLTGVFVNTGREPLVVRTAEWDDGLSGCRQLYKVDIGTGNKVVKEPFSGTLRLDGYGVAVVSNDVIVPEID